MPGPRRSHQSCPVHTLARRSRWLLGTCWYLSSGFTPAERSNCGPGAPLAGLPQPQRLQCRRHQEPACPRASKSHEGRKAGDPQSTTLSAIPTTEPPVADNASRPSGVFASGRCRGATGQSGRHFCRFRFRNECGCISMPFTALPTAMEPVCPSPTDGTTRPFPNIP